LVHPSLGPRRVVGVVQLSEGIEMLAEMIVVQYLMHPWKVMWLVGYAYNFCWRHESLRVAAAQHGIAMLGVMEGLEVGQLLGEVRAIAKEPRS
jgi:hypothetical protein